MERCYKILIVSLLVLQTYLYRTSQIYGLEVNYLENKAETNFSEEKEDKREAVINLNDEEIMLLSKLVAGEARGESYEGQVAVAAVVINRVKDSRFPNTLKGVIYQKNAFSVVKNGTINTEPQILHIEQLRKLCMEKIQLIMQYIFESDISTCKWINTLNPYLRIGNHVFAK